MKKLSKILKFKKIRIIFSFLKKISWIIFPFKKFIHYLIFGLFYIYRSMISPFIQHNSCRYLPTCSEYGHNAIKIHGIFKGGYLTIKRILRCNPLGGSGYDPVPKKK